MTWAAVSAAAIGAAGSMAGGMMGGSKGGSQAQSTSNNNSVAKWLLPYQKALVERQYNLSNQPYQAYPGLLQQFSQALQNENDQQQQHPWDNFLNQQNSNSPQGLPQQFLNSKDRPFNPLTAKPGENLPLQLSSKDYTRYMQSLADNPNYQAKTMSASQLKQWKKDNAGISKYLGDQPYQLKDGVFNQSVAAQLSNQQQQQAPNIIDQYYAPRSMKGLLG